MVSKTRARRIADRIFEELSLIILNKINDPRLINVSITGVKVDKELSYADIYVSSIEGSEKAPEILEGLKHANGYMRSELASRIQLRSFPRLRFHWDPIPEHADKIHKLISSLHEHDQDKEATNTTSTDV